MQEFDVEGPLEAAHSGVEAFCLVRRAGRLNVWALPECDVRVAGPRLWEQRGIELPNAAAQ